MTDEERKRREQVIIRAKIVEWLDRHDHYQAKAFAAWPWVVFGLFGFAYGIFRLFQ